MPTRATVPNPPSQPSRPAYPAAVAGNSWTPSSPPMGSSAAATCTSAWVSTPPVMARVFTMVIAIPFLRLRDGTHPLAAGPVNPGLLHRTGRSGRHAGRCQINLGPGRRIVSRTAREGVSRFAGQAGTQAPDPTPVLSQDRGSRAGSTIHILPADSALENRQVQASSTALISAIPDAGRLNWEGCADPAGQQARGRW